MRKRVLALLLSGALVMIVIAGCERDAGRGDNAAGTTAVGANDAALNRTGSSSAASGGASSSATPRSPGNSSPAEADRLSALRADAMPSGFDLADQPRAFEFPRDHGPHPTFRHEWWYITGHLDAANGEPFGFELTFFRFALKPPSAVAAVSQPSAWRSSQIYMAHFAVSDIERRQFKVSERFARDAL